MRRSRADRLAHLSAPLVLLAILLCGAPASGAPKLLIIGLDSGDWDYLDPLIASGYVPSIASLVSSGVKADYDCSLTNPGLVCFCPMVWTSVYTGWPSGVHKINSFESAPRDRAVPAIWNVLRARRPGEDALLVAAHTHRPPAPEATWIVTYDGEFAAADQRFILRNAGLEWGWDWGTPSEGTIPTTLFEDVGLLPYSGSTPVLWFPFGGDRVGLEVFKTIIAEEGVPTFSTFIFHSLDRTMHMTCGQVMSSEDGPVDEATLLALADSWTGPVESKLPGTPASQYLEVDLHIAEILALGSWDYVMITADHGMMLDLDTRLPCHHRKSQSHAGTFALMGPGVKSGVELPTQDPLCTAPLAAYLMDLAVSRSLPCVESGEFENSVLPAIFTAAHLAANPPKFVASWEFPTPSGVPVLPSTAIALLALLLVALAWRMLGRKRSLRSHPL